MHVCRALRRYMFYNIERENNNIDLTLPEKERERERERERDAAKTTYFRAMNATCMN